MRQVALLAALAIAGCAEQDGTYLTIRSAAKFDHLDLRFGGSVGFEVPTTPLSPQKLAVTDPQLLYQRLRVPSDTQELGGLVTEYTYYLPATELNLQLGEYLMVVAREGDVDVAAGELLNFEVEPDTILLYDLMLSPFPTGDLELWGTRDAACARWRHDDQVVVIGNPDDLDCDGFDRETDCDELSYCNPEIPGFTGCISTAACVSSEVQTCTYGGACQNAREVVRQCVGTLCLPQGVCDAYGLPDTPGFRENLLYKPQGHVSDAIVPIKDVTRELCLDSANGMLTTTVTVDITRPCVDPQIADFLADQPPSQRFTPVRAEQSPSNPNACAVTMQVPYDHYKMGIGDTVHVLVSIGGLTERPTFVLGLRPANPTVPAEVGCDHSIPRYDDAPIGVCP